MPRSQEGRSHGYSNAEFDSLDEALDFAENLPNNNQLYIKQYGFQVRNTPGRQGKEVTGGTGEFHWLAISQLMTPDAVSGFESDIRAASAHYFYTAPEVPEVPEAPETTETPEATEAPEVESVFLVTWKKL